ncbi:MAG: acyl-CoA dehydrogenase, partial [Sandaracinobacter sp.]
MHFEYSKRTQEMLERLRAFMDEHIYPNEARYEEEAHKGERWKVIHVIEELKPKARAAGLWNMFVPPSHGGVPVHGFHFDGTPLTNLE